MGFGALQLWTSGSRISYTVHIVVNEKTIQVNGVNMGVRAWRNKNIKSRRQGALDRLKRIKEPNKRELKDIKILEERLR